MEVGVATSSGPGDVACLICRSRRHRVVVSYDEPDQYELAVGVGKERYWRRWVQCTSCRFYYSMYSRPPAILDDLYRSGYRDERAEWRKHSVEEVFERVVALPREESETKFRVDWIKERIREVWNSGLVARGAPPYRLLDIGGATGVFAFEFQDEEWRSYVIDPDEKGRFVESRLNIRFAQKKYEPQAFGCWFHLISLIFVLEHVRDPVRLLEALHQDMDAKSLVYIEVPSALAFGLKPPTDDIFNSCHLWMFGPATLTLLLESCGFEVLALNTTRTKRGHMALMALAGQT